MQIQTEKKTRHKTAFENLLQKAPLLPYPDRQGKHLVLPQLPQMPLNSPLNVSQQQNESISHRLNRKPRMSPALRVETHKGGAVLRRSCRKENSVCAAPGIDRRYGPGDSLPAADRAPPTSCGCGCIRATVRPAGEEGSYRLRRKAGGLPRCGLEPQALQSWNLES